LLKSAKVQVDSFWPTLFAKLAEKKNLGDLIANAAGGGAPVAVAAAPVAAAGGGAAAAAPAAEEKKKVTLLKFFLFRQVLFNLRLACGFLICNCFNFIGRT